MNQLEHLFKNNSLESWLAASIAFFAILSITWIGKGLLASKLKKIAMKTTTPWDDVAVTLFEKVHFLFLLILSFHLSIQTLELPPKLMQIGQSVFLFALFIQMGVLGNMAISRIVENSFQNHLSKDTGRAATISALGFLGKLVFWITLILLLLDNFGINVSTLVTGLGIGGIAVALAVQNILGDLLGSLSIVLDKPFIIGDTIAVDNDIGTVEYIGLKTTRVKSLTGEQLIFSNSDLLKSRIRNYKRMSERRVVFSIGLVYETPVEKLHQVRPLLQEIINSQSNARFDRCHLSQFADSSLDFEIVYWVNNSDYNDYINCHHAISLKILEKFNEHNFSFAYPTRKIYTEQA